MASNLRTFTLGSLVALAGILAAGCASEPNAIECPTTGILCPLGTVCAAAQPVCLLSSCGNGLRDSAFEACDDGNILAGDGCSPLCQVEECGNGVPDPQELCDDGNTEGGDGCSADCKSLEDCGNGVVDVGEQCDDGNDNSNDACTQCRHAVCGDGWVRDGVEDCDGDGMGIGDLVNGDGCSTSCRFEGCGNGTLDPGEECDDGISTTDNPLADENKDACVWGCQIAFCGDGFVREGVEDCDDGNNESGDDCSPTCRLEKCGNGSLDPGEQCDDNNELDGDGCSASCRFEACGNGQVDLGEECDGDGMGTGGETATCNIDCTTRSCGDGKLNLTALEQCDNGSGPNGNGNDKNCTATCQINICGDGHRDKQAPGIEACDEGPGGNIDDSEGCSSTCTLEECGNGSLDFDEQCDDGNDSDTDECPSCKFATCGDGHVQANVEECDGGPNCSSSCRIQRCGNGIIDPGEQCDNDVVAVGSQPVNGDGCSSTCRIEYCGDGFDNNLNHEQCDGNNTGGGGQTATCNVNCTKPACGDGIVNSAYSVPDGQGTEQCDDGARVDGDGCSSNCRFERCGNGFVDPGEECDGMAGTRPDGVPSGATCGSTSSASACRWVYCGNGILEGGEQCDNGGANSNSAACTATCTINICGDGLVLAGTEGCDNGANNGDNRACTATCQPNVCGDGKHQTGAGSTEECDDGDTDNTNSCTNACTAATCGDGFIQTGEVCDDFNNVSELACPYGQASCTACSMGCTSVLTLTGSYCGDGAIQAEKETCDDGNSITELTCPYQSTNPASLGQSCTVCTSSCAEATVTTGPHCGDGFVNSPIGAETCDLGTANNTGTCTAGYNGACVACSASCTSTIVIGPHCGDGVCANGETVGTCGLDCMATVPDAPTSPSATAGVKQATVTFTAPASNGGSAITGYTATSTPGGFTGTASHSPVTVTGLSDGTAYTFTVTATNGVGTGPASSFTSSVTTAAVPAAPTMVIATTAAAGEVSVAFTPGSANGSPIASFSVACTPAGGNTGGSSPIVVAGLDNTMMHTCTVTATNAVGTSPPSAASNSVTPL